MMILINKNYKDILGKLLLVLSCIFFIYMILSPFNNLVFQMDENFTIFLLKFPLIDMIHMTGADVHPPLYYMICKGVLKILYLINFQFNIIHVLRLVSITPYFLILIISYLKFKKDYGWFVAGLFPFLLVLMSEFFMYFLNIRMYSWGLLFILLSFICFKEIITNFNKKYWVLFTLFSVLGSYTHYYVAISTFLIYLFLLFYLIKNNRSEIKFFILSVISAIIFYLPWVVILLEQLKKVHESFWIPEVDLNLIIHCFSYFGPQMQDLSLHYLLICILIIFFVIFIHQSKGLNKEDNWYIICGFGVFIGTIFLGVSLSIIYKPILILRYLIPSVAIFWLAVSILINKIQNNKLLIVSLILVGLLCISGIVNIIDTNDNLINWGNELKNVLDELNSDDSVVILSNPTSLAYFSPFLSESDIYILNFENYLTEDSNKIHKIYDFKELSINDIQKLMENSNSKHIYLIEAYSKLDINDSYRNNPMLEYGDGMNFYRIR